MFSFDLPAVILISLNITQMVTIILILLPVVDIITLSKNIKIYIDNVRDSPFYSFSVVMYVILIAGYGIVGPTKTLNSLKRASRLTETPREKLIRVIDSTNATRNYLLGGLSLFYILVAWRLLDYINFSAKLHEFSDLMGNYDLIDITLKEAEFEDTETTFIIDEAIEEEDSVHWPSIADLSRTEQTKLKTFFKETPKKGMSPSSSKESTPNSEAKENLSDVPERKE